ncbi:hypothetical protein PVBG_01189 [Plasmodium vivax Brazil I]|uniref:Uncharacterized protein n=1 Tax=Plasmodium vivax (strain Brazil I) TaxID=1033975 RepID=A0A0J9SRU8_PLAV1|nr:hypothetical protein PVBG_01189 [Plasmodium vivax Brazil I]
MFSKRKVIKRNIRKVTGEDHSNLNVPPDDGGRESSYQEEAPVGRSTTDVCVTKSEAAAPPLPEGGFAIQDDTRVGEPLDEETYEEAYGRGAEQDERNDQLEEGKGPDAPTALHPLLPHSLPPSVPPSQLHLGWTPTQEAATKKGRISSREKKKNEETRKVNRMNTSFHIYSDDEDDCYVALRKRKGLQRGIQSGSIQSGSIHVDDSPNEGNAAKGVEASPVESDAEHREPLPGGLSAREFLIRRYGVDPHQGDANRAAQEEERLPNHEGNAASTKGGQTNAQTYSTQRSGTAPMGDNPFDVDLSGGDASQDRYAHNQRGGCRRGEAATREREEDYQNEGDFQYEGGFPNEEGFQQEEDYQDEEEKRLIERIKLKKQILRKKKKLSDRYSYVLEEGHEGGETAQQFGGRGKMATWGQGGCVVTGDGPLPTGADPLLTGADRLLPGGDPLLSEDDLEVDDIYHYESVSEMKNRLIIKKNKSDEVGSFFGGGAPPEGGHEHEVGSYHADYLKQMQEDDLIRRIVDIKLVSQLKEQKRDVQWGVPPDEGGVSGTFFDGTSKQSNHPVGFNLKKGSSQGDGPPGAPADFPTVNDPGGWHPSESHEGQTGEDEKEWKLTSGHCPNDDAHSSDRMYQDENETLFREIERTFKEHSVCNTQLVEMYKHIGDLFEEYKLRKDESGQVKSLEKIYKKKCIELKDLKRKRTKQLVTCESFFRFFHHMMKLIKVKSNLMNNALVESFEMDVIFFIVYQNLKLYLYREYYENYKLVFAKEYIYNTKYYKRKKEGGKKEVVTLLATDGVVPSGYSTHDYAPVEEHLINEVKHPSGFNDTRVHYLFDGFSSNYSTDSSEDSDWGGTANGAMQNDQATATQRKKRKEQKEKYFQTGKMKALRRRYLISIRNIFKDVHPHFANFKNAIKYFYLLKLHNEDFYVQHKCMSLFDPIFFFFAKWELLFWDPLYQFYQTRTKKRKLLSLVEDQMAGSLSGQMHAKFVQLHRNEHFVSANSVPRGGKQVLPPVLNWAYADDAANSSFEADAAAPAADPYADASPGDPSTGSETGRSMHSSEVEGASSLSSSSAAVVGGEATLEESPMEGESPVGEKPPIVGESPMGENPPLGREKKYKPAKKRFHNNPSVKSFEWYKFMDELMYIYQVDDEQEVLRKLYEHIFNNKVHELVEAWNPLSLKQSCNLCVILAEYLLYNQDRREVTDMVKEKINNCVFTFFEGYKNISSQKKKNIFLMRCLKILKSARGILSLLSDDALHDFVKNIFYNFVLTNYDYSSKLHNLIVSAVVHIILSLGVPKESKIFEDISSVLCGITDRLRSGDFDYGKFKMEN